MWNKLANSEDHARYTSLCSRFSLDRKPGRTADLRLPTSTSMSSELGWARFITTRRGS